MQRLYRSDHYIIKSQEYLFDRELIARCICRDEEAQRLLFDRFVTLMARLCQRYLKDKDDVQDVLMEGFMKVYHALAGFAYTDERGLEGWIRRIMVNQCLMRLRKMKALPVEHYGDEVMDVADAGQPDLSAEEIMKLIHTLPDGYRAVFNLFVIDGFSHKEIGELLGISESASRSQLTHARSRLKDLLKAHGWK
jgi:RNA polymerase sigma factor (sigma-70 family)